MKYQRWTNERVDALLADLPGQRVGDVFLPEGKKHKRVLIDWLGCDCEPQSVQCANLDSGVTKGCGGCQRKPGGALEVAQRAAALTAKGVKPGLVFNPAMPVDVLEWVIDKVDVVLLMSVNPGFGGQSFIDSTLRKAEKVRKIIDASGRDIRLEIDGGVKVDNIRRVADAGADTFVAGSAIFGQPSYKAVIDAMRAELAR